MINRSEALLNASKVSENSRVLVHYTIYLTDGSVAESTLDSNKPQWIRCGKQEISKQFEDALQGLTIDDEKRIFLTAKDAFGDYDKRQIRLIPRERFPSDLALEAGSIVAFSDYSGKEVPGIIRRADEGLAIVDFNHPLAGQDLVFVVKIVDID